MSRPRKSEEEKKANRAAYMHEYWKTHREERNAATKKWRKNHPEKTRETMTETSRIWREKNREKYNKYQREYYLKVIKPKRIQKEKTNE